jgi:hypothetical protein
MSEMSDGTIGDHSAGEAYGPIARMQRLAAEGKPGEDGTYQRLCWVLHGASGETCERLRNALGLDCGTAGYRIAAAALENGKVGEALDMLSDLEAELLERHHGGVCDE